MSIDRDVAAGFLESLAEAVHDILYPHREVLERAAERETSRLADRFLSSTTTESEAAAFLALVPEGSVPIVWARERLDEALARGLTTLTLRDTFARGQQMVQASHEATLGAVLDSIIARGHEMADEIGRNPDEVSKLHDAVFVLERRLQEIGHGR